ncbi:hypothetical protein PLICRDRAFT_384194 [Plicaturopsis crispa FD-325 SS-3]|nr:hypothetical protein PLICRDRAFT_384194 [Plicaturopsis crispa FD-325 SS-3]
MTSYRITNHRRRSHSTSESTPSPPPLNRRLQHGGWRATVKRNRPFSQGFPESDSPQKWDVDAWRRDQRARKTSGKSPILRDGDVPALDLNDSNGSTVSAPHTPAFASTSAEFQLFPKRSIHPERREEAQSDSNPSSADIELLHLDDLTRLRSDAFWELRQSIADSGETLVGKMRDYEASRSKSGAHNRARSAPMRGRKRPAPSCRASRNGAEGDSEDDDGVQIVDGEPASWSPRKKRALSLGTMDVSAHCIDDAELPSDTSATHSDLEDDFAASRAMYQFSFAPSPPSASLSFPTSDFTPELSYTHSTNSSLSSLPLPPPRDLARVLGPQTLPDASRSEKALAALSLAMANGAGGLNDYEALRAVAPPPTDDYHIGELWH